jgi:hypothetical protein
MNAKNVPVNLASRPLRNRRFFFAALLAFAAVFALAALAAGLSLRTSHKLEAGARTDLDRITRLSESARKEKDAWSAEAAELARKLKDTVEAVNGIIQRKSFSLVDVFTRLEEALPVGSYIAGISPVAPADGRLDLRFRVVSPSLPELLALVQKLGGLGFKNISVKNEATVEGRLVSEITFSHERPL